MKNFIGILTGCMVFFCFMTQNSNSCTTFCLDLDDGPVFGRNFDWKTGKGSIYINKKGISKTAQSVDASNRLVWVSKYGSATFNQLGYDRPYGGMNEVGLVVETMILPETVYPQSPDPRPEIGLYQWIQYQLDNYSTIEDVIESDSQVRIRAKTGAHFLVCDASGNCAVIEFLKGSLVYHDKERLPVSALSNSKYSEALGFWKNDQVPENDRRRSIGRFVCTAGMMQAYDSKIHTPVDYAFMILSRAANPSDTQWSIVYDIRNLGIYFRTKANRKIRFFFLKALDFSNTGPVKTMEVNRAYSGDITSRFIDYKQ